MELKDIEAKVGQLLADDAVALEAALAELSAKIPEWPSPAFKEMMEKSFKAGWSSGSTQATKMFMEKIMPLMIPNPSPVKEA